MKFDCSKDQLIQAINIVQRGVAAKSTITVLEGILFTADENCLILTSTNNEISVQTEIPANVEEEGKIVLGSSFIAEIIRKLSGETVFFSTDAFNQVKLECLLSSFNIKGMPADEFPAFPTINEEYDFRINAQILKSMIQKTLFSVAVNDNIPVLTGMKLEIDDDSVTLVALDGYRMALCRDHLEAGIDDFIDVIIPGRSMQEMNKMLSGFSGEVVVRFSKTQIFFEFGNTRFISRLMEGEFINYKTILPDEYDTEVMIERQLLLASCERAALLAREGKNNLIKMDFGFEHLELTSHAEIGEVREIIPTTLKGNELRIAFNSKFMIEALKAIQDDKVIMKLTSAVGPSIMMDADEKGGYVYMILPVRIAD